MSSTLQPTRAERVPADGEIPEGLVEIGVVPSLPEYLRQMWDRRDFILTVPLGQLRAQNQNTVFGQAWHLLNPLLLAGVYYLVFGIIFPQTRVENYAAYLVIGIITFNFTNKVMMGGTRTVINNQSLIKQIRFPRASLPLSSAIAESYAQWPAMASMLAIVLIVTGFDPPTWEWLLLVPAYVIQTVFNLGLAFLTARMTFHFRDIENLLPFLIRIWMYTSGLFFPLQWVIDKAEANDVPWFVDVFEANPLWIFMTLARDALLDCEDPTLLVPGTVCSVDAPPHYWWMAIGWAVVALVGGFLYFRANESEYARD